MTTTNTTNYIRHDMLDLTLVGPGQTVYKRDQARIATLEANLEHERIKLAACGVVARANTRDSAAKVRQMSPEYRSASLDDVERAVDREIAERERRKDAEAALGAVVACHNVDPILIAREPGYRWHDVITQAIAHFARYKD